MLMIHPLAKSTNLETFLSMVSIDAIATTGTDHLPQLPLLGEFATQDAQVGDEVHANRNDGFFGGD